MINTMITTASAARKVDSMTAKVTLPEAPAWGTVVGFTAWIQNLNGEAETLK